MIIFRSQPARAVSPSLVAAKNVNVNRDFLDDGERKVMMMMKMVMSSTRTSSMMARGGDDHHDEEIHDQQLNWSMTTKFYYKTETRNNNEEEEKLCDIFSDFQVEQLRLERERELQEMRRMREQEMEMEELQVAKLRSTLSSSLQDGPKKVAECCWGHIAPIPGTSCQ